MKLVDLDLDVYQGPFDLLFSLVVKEEVDILEIPVLDVILTYVERVAAGPEVDWDSLSEFLVLISALLQLKVRRLLPGEEAAEDQPPVDEARDLLIARLLRYQQCKGAAAYLRSRAGAETGRVLRRPDRMPVVRLAPDHIIAGSEPPALLSSHLLAVLERHRQPDTSHLAGARVAVKRQVGVLRRLLRVRGQVSFEEEFGTTDPMVQAATVLAICNLIARGEVEASQRRPFGDIIIRVRQGHCGEQRA